MERCVLSSGPMSSWVKKSGELDKNWICKERNILRREHILHAVGNVIRKKWKQGVGQGLKNTVHRPKLRSCTMTKVNSENIPDFNFICVA